MNFELSIISEETVMTISVRTCEHDIVTYFFGSFTIYLKYSINYD